MRSLSSLLSNIRSAWTAPTHHPAPSDPASPLDTDALWRDGEYFWKQVDVRPQDVRRALHERYPLIPRAYSDRYLDHILAEHRPNPLALLYIESELGAPARQLTLLAELESAGMRLAGRRCLDIGCSNGSLLLAAKGKGAVQCVGVDVSADRLASARQLCDGADIDLHLLDLGSADLPPGRGPFEAIFCTDVLEHVESIPAILGAMARHLARTPEARIFMTVFNHLTPGCVSSEPHYGVPGLVLLDRGRATSIWQTVRGQLKSALDYEVEQWPEYSVLVEQARHAGLQVVPLIDKAGVLASRRTFFAGYAERFAELERETAARLEQLAMAAEDRELLRDRIAGYCREATAAHRAFEAALPGLGDDDVVAFYLRYYAQPLRCFLTHA